MRDLLTRFVDPDHHLNGLSRFSDLHLKIGESVTYRYDGDLATICGAVSLSPSICKQIVLALLDS